MPWWSNIFKSREGSPATPSDLSSFFVVTAIFNPAGFTSRYDLYHTFASHLAACGVQLVTVEAIFPSLGQNSFQVTQPNNPFHVQVVSPSIYWMKENLINIGVRALPTHAKYVCWLDADITFESKTWVGPVLTALKKWEVVQVFKKAKFMGPKQGFEQKSKVLRTDYSFGYSVVHGKIIDQLRYAEWYPHPGYGWAMSISTFHAIGGLPIYDIVGSGDLHFAFSLLNRISNALEDQLHPEFKSLIVQGSNETFQTISSMAKATGKEGLVGYAPLTIRHNWHGSRSDRQYVDRWKILIAHQFNFSTDVSQNEGGLLEFVGPKGDDLQRDILSHFYIRKEDGKKVNGSDLMVIAAVMGAVKKKKQRGRKKNGSSSSSSDDNDYHMRMVQQGSADSGAWIPPPCQPPPTGECPYPGTPCPDPGLPCPEHPECPPGHDHHHHEPGGHDDHDHDHHHHGGYPGGGYDGIETSTQY